ncbi:MAG: porin family protein [Phreatobacter sp.]|uniref:outer membrane protein n=1 Tax=Phreatobacter sp. TaxID=1966341 RepID=UPI001A4032AC|nr:outer membrane protein [Phreatobacter sp.]MBL8568453.1 porin family protein [Phreatobacter sp.]
MPRAPVAAAIVMPAFSWTGAYVGVQAGYGWGRNSGTACDFTRTFCNPYSGSVSGAVFGGHAGYNYQINQMVLGLEADLEYNAGRTASTHVMANFGLTLVNRVSGSIQGSLRGRLGVAFDRALIYATGGLAFSRNSFDWWVPAGPIIVSYARASVGWTLGAGVEFALTPDWTARLEYRYANFAGTRFSSAVSNSDVTHKLDTHTVRLGVSYRFSTGPSAVVARY